MAAKRKLDETSSTSMFHRARLKGSLGLNDIRENLIRQEETIIFGLIERSQFAHNAKCYGRGLERYNVVADRLSGGHSYMEYFLLETEKLHSMCSRYQCPDENAFFPEDLPVPVLATASWPQILNPNVVNVNPRIMSQYVENIVPQICSGGAGTDDDQYGSTATSDISVLQAISKRVHFGKFVAEAKFQAETEKYTALIKSSDAVGIMEALTNKAVEDRLLRRVRHKAQMYGSEIEEEGPCQDAALKVNPEVIVEVYRDFLIPLTKDVEVEYLLQRLGPLPVACVGGVSGSRDAANMVWNLGKAETGFGPLKMTPMVTSAFDLVRSGHAAQACLPLETSETGVVKATVQEFVNEVIRNRGPQAAGCQQLCVLGEVYVPAAFALVSRPGNIMREVAAEAETLRLCQDALRSKHKELVHSPVQSAVEALQRAKSRAGVAAIVPDEGGDGLGDSMEGMHKERLQGAAVNHFIVIGFGPGPIPSGKDRTLVLFAVREAPGALVEALKAFEAHGVNMSGIHSFLIATEFGENMFLVQVDGHKDEAKVAGALSQLSQCTAVAMFSCLGSFPAATRPMAAGRAKS